MWLVHALKDQLVPVCAEPLRQLFPQGGEHRQYPLYVGGIRHQPGIGTGHGGAIVVHVKDHIHIQLHCPVDHLLHPIQPCLLQLVSGGGTEMPRPGHRDPDHVKACIRHGLQHLPGHGRIEPGGFRRQPLVRGKAVQGVPQIPADMHPGGGLCPGARGTLFVHMQHSILSAGSDIASL